jgi:hypothetical protein
MMNKFITMLILGVLAAAMLLVLGMHVRQSPDEAPSSPIAAGSLAGTATETVAGGAPADAGADMSGSLRVPVLPPADSVVQPSSTTGPLRPSGPAQETPADTVAGSGQPTVIPVRSDASAAAGTPAASTSAGASAASTGASRQASVDRGRGSIIEISLQFRGRGMALVIEGDGPLPARHFVLTGPDRLVVDLPGAWRNLKAPAVPSNNLVQSVRLGRQDNADRLVLDLKTKLKSHGINRINDKKVEVLFN